MVTKPVVMVTTRLVSMTGAVVIMTRSVVTGTRRLVTVAQPVATQAAVKRFRRRELRTTLTLERAMAKAAIGGESSRPKAG